LSSSAIPPGAVVVRGRIRRSRGRWSRSGPSAGGCGRSRLWRRPGGSGAAARDGACGRKPGRAPRVAVRQPPWPGNPSRGPRPRGGGL